MILTEQQYEGVDLVTEAVGDDKKTYIKGIMSVAEERNRNGRIYSKEDLQSVEKQINESAKLNRHILGACDHPNSLDVKLEEVSHRLMEANMNDKNELHFKAEILEKHPKGAIVKSLIDSGVQIGVSTRGSGSVNESSGRVSNFRFVTLDCVATPSCPHSYTTSLQEQFETHQGQIVTDLAEAQIHDPLAQAYFQSELRKFIDQLTSTK